MKYPNKFVTNTTLAICGSSLLITSCDAGLNDIEMVTLSQLPDVGESSIEIELNQEDQKYLTFLNKLSLDIINQPEIAQDFAKDPQKYIEKYGYNEEINLDENMLNYILTLGDVEIQNAIKQNDIDAIVRLMREKCLVTSNFTKIELTQEQISQLNEFYGLTKQNLKRSISPRLAENDKVEAIVAVFAAVVWVFVAVIEDAVAAYNVGVGLNAAAYTNLYYKTAAWGSKKISKLNSSEKIAIETNLSFKAICAKAPNKNEYFFANRYIEEFSKQVVNTLEKETPKVLKGMNKNELQEIIKYNMYLKAQKPNN